MDKNVHYKIINPDQKRRPAINKVWSQKCNILPEGMPHKLINQKRQVKYMVDLLNEEIKKYQRKKDLNRLRRSDSENGISSHVEEYISPHVKKMLQKIGKNVNHIKESIMDITRMNGLYLGEKTKKIFMKTQQMKRGEDYGFNKNNSALDLRRKRVLRKINTAQKENNNNFSQLNQNLEQNTDLVNKDNKDNKNNKNKKEEYTKNFLYVNNNYRRQLNFAFLKYNSEKHLENMKFLVKADPTIREDINSIIDEVEKDIKWKCDKKHFAKKYFNLIEKNRKMKMLKELHNKEKMENNKDKTFLPNIKNNKDKKKYVERKFKKKTFSSIYQKISYGVKYNKKELNKLNQQKEQSKEEMNHMLVASKEIDNFLQDDNINNKIDMFQTDYARCMYGFNYDENKNVNLLDKDYFLEEKENIVDKIGTVYCFKINKNTNEQENLFKGRIYDEAKKFRKRIIDGKKSALDEFNGYLTNYDIKLVKDKKEEKEEKGEKEEKEDINNDQTEI